jgi:hypothetical protein
MLLGAGTRSVPPACMSVGRGERVRVVPTRAARDAEAPDTSVFKIPSHIRTRRSAVRKLRGDTEEIFMHISLMRTRNRLVRTYLT